MKPTTLEEALAMVPTHWMLTPGVDVWQEGDVWHERGMTWRIEKANRDIGRKVNIPFAGRPIPQDVREKSAVRILYNSTATVTSRSSGWLRFLYPEVDSEEGGIVVACYKDVCTEDNYGLRKFSSREQLRGFWDLIPSRLSDVDLYDNVNPLEEWILAGKP